MSWLNFRDPVSTWTHLIWLVLSVPATWLLWQRSCGDRAKQLSLLTFGLDCSGSVFASYEAIHDSVRERV